MSLFRQQPAAATAKPRVVMVDMGDSTIFINENVSFDEVVQEFHEAWAGHRLMTIRGGNSWTMDIVQHINPQHVRKISSNERRSG